MAGTVFEVKRTLRPIAVVAFCSALVIWPTTRTAALTLLALLAVVAIHEAGHFFAAKTVGVGAPEFSLGFGPVVFATSGKRTGTVFVLRALPLGGFVKVRGMDSSILEGPDDDLAPVESGRPLGKSYSEVSHLKRAFIAVAGPAANIFSAFLLLMAVFMFLGRAEATGTVSPQQGSPAELGGIRAGDTILEVNGSAQMKNDLSAAVSTAGEANTVIVLKVKDALGDVREVEVRPFKVSGGWRIGLLADTVQVSRPVWDAAPDAAVTTKNVAVKAVASFSGLAGSVVALPLALLGVSNDGERMLSPVGVARLAEHSATKQGYLGPLALIAAMSIFVALFNLLPLPPLDGAHVGIAIYEGVASRLRRRKVVVDQNVLRPLTALVIACILALSVGTVLLDLLHPVRLP